MSSTSGWILDAHLCSAQLEMLVWIVTEEGSVVSFREPWHPTLHVAGSSSDLEHLRNGCHSQNFGFDTVCNVTPLRENDPNWVPSIRNICLHLHWNRVQHYALSPNTSMRVVSMFDTPSIL